MKAMVFFIGWLCFAYMGFSQVNDSTVYGHYKKFVTDHKDYFEGYAFICDSLESLDDITYLVRSIPETKLPVSKNAKDNYLTVSLDSIYKISGLKLSILSRKKFYDLPNRINPGITAQESALAFEVDRLHNLIMSDEKNKDYYIRKMDSIFNSSAYKSSDRKVRNSKKRLLIFMPPVIRENKIVIACISYNNIADSEAFYNVYSLSTNKKK